MNVESNPYVVVDERFRGVQGDTWVEKLYGGCRWAEGPVYVPAGRYLIWSDIPNDRILRWDEVTGRTGLFRQPAGYTNGNTRDLQGRLLSCEHGHRRVIRTEHDGSTTVIADGYRGMQLNSPNDVVVDAGGAIWFTDSSYGIDSDYEGIRADRELEGCYVFRVDPSSQECVIVADDFERPTGIAFSPDERRMYVADSRANHIRVFEVSGDGKLSGGGVFATNSASSFDGLRLDEAGRLWIAASDGVHCIDSDGTLIGKISVPECVANVEFGGPKRNRLFICASTSLYSIMLTVNGARH